MFKITPIWHRETDGRTDGQHTMALPSAFYAISTVQRFGQKPFWLAFPTDGSTNEVTLQQVSNVAGFPIHKANKASAKNDLRLCWLN